MNKLDRLEIFAQRLIEGSFNRFFKVKANSVASSPALALVEEHKTDRTETAEIQVATSNVAAHWYLQLGERQLRLGEPVIRLGRALDNDIILNDPTVSRYHAQLRWRGEGYHLCLPAPADQGGGKGPTNSTQQLEQEGGRTSVNHQPVIQKNLVSGDVIKLGNTILTVFVETGNI